MKKQKVFFSIDTLNSLVSFPTPTTGEMVHVRSNVGYEKSYFYVFFNYEKFTECSKIVNNRDKCYILRTGKYTYIFSFL